MELTTALVFLMTFIFSALVVKKFRQKKYRLPPGPAGLPIIGHFLQVCRRADDLHVYAAELAREHGPIFCLRMGEVRLVFLTSVPLIRECAIQKADTFSDRPTWLYFNALLRQGDGGVVFRNGAAWRRMRRFGLSTMRDFGVGKRSIEGKIGEELEHLLREFKQTEGEPFDCLYPVNNAVSNIICAVCFGDRYEYTNPKFHQLLELINFNFTHGGARLLEPANMWPIFRLFPLSKATQQTINNIEESEKWVKDVINQKRDTFDPTDISNLVDVYLDNERKSEDNFSDFDMQRLILDLFITGTETTSTTVRWGLLYMLAYPDVQRRCQAEIDREVGRDARVRYADRARLPYVEATLAELQRISNILPLGVQHSAREDGELGGYHIPRNSIIILCQHAVCMDERVFTEPHKFDPTRFLDEQQSFRKHDALSPFGVGPRVCMGEALARMEVFLLFSSLLQKFTFRKEAPDTEPDLRGTLGITLCPPAFRVRALPR